MTSQTPLHPRFSPRGAALAAITIAAVLSSGLAGSAAVAAATVAPAGVISDTASPQTVATPITGGMELGVRFSPIASGTLSGVQFYQNAFDSGVTSASVWSSSGALLARVPVSRYGLVGWRIAPVDIELEAGRTYTVSVFDSNGRFPLTEGFFATAKTTNGISTPAKAGVYRLASASSFPNTADAGSTMVDVVFVGDPGPSPEPTTTPAPAPSAPPQPETPPRSSAVFGPDGTHWPADTPRADEARMVNVAASWNAISAAIAANATTSDDVVICVAPGTITGGSGAGSSSKGVLQNIGNAARASRILVTACDGVGTVKTSGSSGIAFVGVEGVSIVGIDMAAQPVMIRNAEAFAIGYTEVPTLLVTANGGDGVQDVEIIEVVAGADAARGVSNDRVEVKSAGGYDVDGLRFAGFYAAPHYKPSGSSGHTDTIQFVTTSGGGVIENVVIEDSAVFQSSSQGIMAGGNSGGEIRNAGFFGGPTGQLRYPVYAGGHTIVLANMLHGTWAGVKVTDSVVAGSVSSSYSFAQVVNSRSTKGDRGFDDLGELTLAELDALAPVPNEARLDAIWG